MQVPNLGVKSCQRPFEILLVEDSSSDVLLATEALSRSSVPNKLHVVSDGVAATNFLNRCDPYSQAPRPDLILLDLNLPKKDGREVLTEIKTDVMLREIPVVVLTPPRRIKTSGPPTRITRIATSPSRSTLRVSCTSFKR